MVLLRPTLLGLILAAGGCVQSPSIVLVDPTRIEASLSERQTWVREQKRRDRTRFERDHAWLLAAREIGRNEALQLGYLFFYSSGTLCGYLDNPRKVNGVWRLDFYPGLGPGSSAAVLVDPASRDVWQEGQSSKVNALALIRYE